MFELVDAVEAYPQFLPWCSGTDVLYRDDERTRATVLLKGSATLVGAPGQKIAVNPTGHPVLATGGTGDVLTGVIAALARGSEPFRAACAGAYVHGRAAELAAARRGVDRGVLAHEIADEVPKAIAGLSAEPRRVPV